MQRAGRQQEADRLREELPEAFRDVIKKYPGTQGAADAQALLDGQEVADRTIPRDPTPPLLEDYFPKDKGEIVAVPTNPDGTPKTRRTRPRPRSSAEALAARRPSTSTATSRRTASTSPATSGPHQVSAVGGAVNGPRNSLTLRRKVTLEPCEKGTAIMPTDIPTPEEPKQRSAERPRRKPHFRGSAGRPGRKRLPRANGAKPRARPPRLARPINNPGLSALCRVIFSAPYPFTGRW